MTRIARPAHPGQFIRMEIMEPLGLSVTAARELGIDLIVYVNPEGLKMSINPFVHGSTVHTDIMKTQALKQALDLSASTRRSAAPAATRKSPGRRSESSPSARPSITGTPRTSAPSCGASTIAASTSARASAFSRCPTGPSSTCGSTSTASASPSCRCISRRSAPWSSATEPIAPSHCP